MGEVWIRDVPEGVIVAVDDRAAELTGAVPDEYLRRCLNRHARRSTAEVRTADLERFGWLFGDLAEPGVMTRAWS
ncbi:type II toxin-antitoxin system VapB family antitoxin [Saccharomonospora halophila]